MGDAAAELGRPAAEHYREAQRLLLPAGAVWTDRASYDRRMEAFERIQQKLYGLDGTGSCRDLPVPRAQAPPPARRPEAERLPSESADLSVWDFFPGLAIRVVQNFADYDGQEICAGEILHFIESSYFFYEGGHTLRFAEKTIRLADVVEAHQPIIANTGNAWFQPLDCEREPQRV
jgi:hypothetical protein